MRGPDSNLLDSAVGWHRDNSAFMSVAGVQSTLAGPSVGRAKNSTTIELVSPRLLAAVTIWDSGECEVITAPVVPDGGDPSVEVFALAGDRAVRELLDRVGAELVGGRGKA